jgi:Protein of unknown function (DUF3995)
MLQAAQIINTVIFLALSGLHIYWGFSSLFGKKDINMSAVVPEINGKAAFKPSTFATFIVAIWLLGFAKLSGFNLIPSISFQYFSSIIPWGNLAIAIIFLVRAVGDFKMVGFFKKIKNTKFAKNDTKYYSPLCILISICAFIIYLGFRHSS